MYGKSISVTLLAVTFLSIISGCISIRFETHLGTENNVEIQFETSTNSDNTTGHEVTATVSPAHEPVTPTPTLKKDLTAADYGKLIYEENFDKTVGWDLVGNKVENGNLIMGPETDAVPYTGSVFTDFIFESQFSYPIVSGGIEFDIRQQYPPCSGWICSIVVVIDLPYSNVVAYRWEEGKHGPPIALAPIKYDQLHLQPNQWNRITIIAEGENYKVYINDVFVISFADKTYDSGSFILNNPGKTEVKVDYIRIYELPSLPTSETSISPPTNAAITLTKSPAPTKNADMCDDFDSSQLNSKWLWVNPLDDAEYNLIESPGFLRLKVSGRGHDLYQNLNAPRMIKLIAGDFIVETKVTINPVANYQGAGLILWHDENNYVRLERTLVLGVDLLYRVRGEYTAIHLKYSSPTVYLQMELVGNTLTARYSQDGISWIDFGAIGFIGASDNFAGLDLVNEWQDGIIVADFDYFYIGNCK